MAINFNRAEFVLSAVRQGAFIRDGRAQVTFAGRSNVGKSSVINRLLNRKNFARVGATPGKTTQVNYFLIDGKIYFTDLPGYGYAKVSKDERDRWGRLMGEEDRSGDEESAIFHHLQRTVSPDADSERTFSATGAQLIVAETEKESG